MMKMSQMLQRLFRYSIFSLSFLLISCDSDYVKFRAIKYDQDSQQLYYDDNYTKEFEEDFIRVLDFFHEDYYIKNGELYIKRKLAKDKNYLWNLCNKSNDEWLEQTTAEWIKNHSSKSDEK